MTKTVQELHGRAALVDASMVRPKVSESGESLRASTRWNVQQLAVDCTEADFRTLETALYQILHSTTTHEPLRMVQQVQGQKGFEVWHMIVRRYDERNTSDRSSAYAALISNLSERDQQRTWGNSMTIPQELHQRDELVRRKVWKIRDEEKTLAVKRRCPEFTELSISVAPHCQTRNCSLRWEDHHGHGHDTFGIQGEQN